MGDFDVDDVSVELSGDLVLVLLALVARLNEREEVVFEDQAEQRALWDLESLLESVAPSVVSDDFVEALQAARVRLRDQV